MSTPLLSHFTPSLMSPETLERIFVRREPIAQHLIEQIRESALTPNKHHMLLVGPRGIGKTHLVALVYHRLKAMPDLQDRLRIALLREEEWGVDSFLDLLVRIFRALQSEYPAELPCEAVEALYALDPIEAERDGIRLLTEFAGSRTLLLIAENLDDLFKGLEDSGQRKLRAFLQETGICAVLATSQSLFNGVSRHNAPFYGFFGVEHLEKFSLEDAILLLINIATIKGDPELAEFIGSATGRARLRAVHHLAGGNPRVYVILSQFLTRESLDELVGPFLNTLDELTPYYQARLAYLSNQQRKIIEFLCDWRGAAPVKEIARRCFISPPTTSSQLVDLRAKGYVQSTTVGRDSYYELREPLMRLCIEVKKHRGEPIQIFVDFLRLWYSRTELECRLTALDPAAVLEQIYIQQALTLIEQQSEDPRVAACEKDLKSYIDARDWERALTVTDELIAIRGNTADWGHRSFCLGLLERWEDMIPCFNKLIDLEEYDLGYVGLASVNFQLGRFAVAVEIMNQIVERELHTTLDSFRTQFWYMFAFSLAALGRIDEAMTGLNKVREIDPSDSAGYIDNIYLSISRSLFQKAVFLLDHIFSLQNVSGEEVWCTVRDLTHDAFEVILIVTDKTRWDNAIATLIEVFAKHEVIFALGQELVRSIPILYQDLIGVAQARQWLQAWQQQTSDLTEFAMPLRLLDAAVRYKETADQRILLELPIEERSLLEEMVKNTKQAEATIDSVSGTESNTSRPRYPKSYAIAKPVAWRKLGA